MLEKWEESYEMFDGRKVHCEKKRKSEREKEINRRSQFIESIDHVSNIVYHFTFPGFSFILMSYGNLK